MNIEILQMRMNNITETFGGIKMKRVLSAHKAERRQQTIKPKDVIAMKMANEDMIYPSEPYSVFSELQLRSLSTVY